MDGLVLLLLEAGVALALLLFIVWWTWPRRRRTGSRGDAGEADREGGRGQSGDG